MINITNCKFEFKTKEDTENGSYLVTSEIDSEQKEIDFSEGVCLEEISPMFLQDVLSYAKTLNGNCSFNDLKFSLIIEKK